MTDTGKRDMTDRTDAAAGTPPAGAVELYTFGASHFCEKARWALDLAEVPYRETCWAPGPHLMLARRLGAKHTSVPILRVGGASGAVIQGSALILDWIGLPKDERDLETHFDRVVGRLVQRLLYSATLGAGAIAEARRHLIDDAETASWQRLAGWALWPVTRRVVVRTYVATGAALPATVEALDRELARLDALVASGRPFLWGGDAPGRDDITAAALLAPLAQPPQHPLYGTWSPPAGLAAILERWSARPALQWVRGLYAASRHYGRSRVAVRA